VRLLHHTGACLDDLGNRLRPERRIAFQRCLDEAAMLHRRRSNRLLGTPLVPFMMDALGHPVGRRTEGGEVVIRSIRRLLPFVGPGWFSEPRSCPWRVVRREFARPTVQGKTGEPSFGCNQRLRVNAEPTDGHSAKPWALRPRADRDTRSRTIAPITAEEHPGALLPHCYRTSA